RGTMRRPALRAMSTERRHHSGQAAFGQSRCNPCPHAAPRSLTTAPTCVRPPSWSAAPHAGATAASVLIGRPLSPPSTGSLPASACTAQSVDLRLHLVGEVEDLFEALTAVDLHDEAQVD